MRCLHLRSIAQTLVLQRPQKTGARQAFDGADTQLKSDERKGSEEKERIILLLG